MDAIEIRGGRPLHGEVEVSGSKNAALPMLAAALLAEGTHELGNVPGLAGVVSAGGLVVLEHHEGHGENLPALFPAAEWRDVTSERDLAGLPRFTWAIRR